MERKTFDRVLQSGQPTHEQLHPTEFVHPNIHDILDDLAKIQTNKKDAPIKAEIKNDSHKQS